MDPALTAKLLNPNALQEPGPTMTIEERLATLVQKLNPSGEKLPCKMADVSDSGSLALQLCELVDVAAKMTQLDGLYAKAAETAPVMNAEAKKWQELSMNAMHLSREALAEQQKRCVQKLAEFSNSSVPVPVPSSKIAYPAASAIQATPAATCPQRNQQSQKAACPPSNAATVAKQKEPAAERGWNGTLRTHLSTLQNEDPMSILIVRRINRLGFESDEALKEYFTQLGGVRHVLVAHSRVKPNAKRPLARVRPAGIGFVVMASQEETNKVLSLEEHVVRNVSVQVHRYESRCPMDEDLPEEEDALGSYA